MVYFISMIWTVTATNKVEKRFKKLPHKIKAVLYVLIAEIREQGPIRGNWSNYSSLGEKQHHCHIKKGHPTYVVVWEVTNKEIRIVEINYVGTHEKAPY